ncbi:DUF5668 domain-containing protein [Bacillus tianshenii]|uniref:LiaF transmembrane domain-containing protein n=1 Tax=Sutcliffiella tianshenii TaxID=1463404 RepID=UPI001CD7479C|nr:DUF5668 domain-containing protein [Bacillus tianshenii]MCA1318725.1 DUF5668 domain-containing protein [Bacillus tianshenii]
MKKNSFLPGLLLLLFGAYFLLEQMNIELWQGTFTWPTILVITGFALLLQAYKQNDHANILPGFVLLGVGLHFHLKGQLTFWPDHFAVIILIVGLGFIFRYQKTKNGLFEGLVLSVIASFFLFSNTLMEMLGTVENGFSTIHTFWPAVLILIGAYLIFKKK